MSCLISTLGTLITAVYCFSGLSKGRQQFTSEEAKIFSAKLVCFENFLGPSCLPAESSQEVLSNWEKMYNLEALSDQATVKCPFITIKLVI